MEARDPVTNPTTNSVMIPIKTRVSTSVFEDGGVAYLSLESKIRDVLPQLARIAISKEMGDDYTIIFGSQTILERGSLSPAHRDLYYFFIPESTWTDAIDFSIVKILSIINGPRVSEKLVLERVLILMECKSPISGMQFRRKSGNLQRKKPDPFTRARILARLPHENPHIVDRRLNPDRVKKYLEKLDSEIFRVIGEFIDSTRYVTYPTLFKRLKSVIQIFKGFYDQEILKQRSQDSPDFGLYLLVDPTKNGSKIWLLQIVIKTLLKLPNFFGVITPEEVEIVARQSESIILTFNDFIYSGRDLANMIHDFLDNLTVLISKTCFIDEGAQEVKFTLTFCPIMAFTSDWGMMKVGKIIKDFNIEEANVKLICHLHPFMGEKIDAIPIPEALSDACLLSYGINYEILYPIYFDYEVMHSGIYLKGLIRGEEYGSLLKNNPDRTPIDYLVKKLEKKKFF